MPDDVYTHGHAEAVLRSHRSRTIANSAAYFAPHLEPGRSLLDVGCGPGTITAEFATRLDPGPVLGVDRSQDVIDAAAAEHEAPNLRFEVADVYELTLDDASFDLVHAHQVLQHLSDPVAALREMGRVCRPGGVIGVRDADYGGFRWGPVDPHLDDWLELYRSVARRNEAEPDAGRFLVAWATAAGFEDVEASRSRWRFETPDERAWWGGLWADRIAATALADQAVEGGLATRDDLAAMAEAFRRWAATEGAWFEVPQGELLIFR